MFNLLYISCLFTILSLLIPISVSLFAQDNPRGITLSPAQISLDISKDQKIEKEFTIFNNEDATLEFEISFADLSFDLNILENSSNTDFLQLITEKNFTLQPKESKKIKYHVSPPSQAEEGSYSFLILINQKAQANIEQSSVIEIIPHKVEINLSNSGKVEPSVKIVNLVSSSQLQITSDLNFSFDLRNDSKFSAKPIAYFQLLDYQNNIIYKEVLNSDLAPIPPNSSKSFVVNLSQILPPGPIDVELLVVETKSMSQDFTKITFFSLYWHLIVLSFAVFFCIVIAARIYYRYLSGSSQNTLTHRKIGRIKKQIS
jgi:hypothetical protein